MNDTTPVTNMAKQKLIAAEIHDYVNQYRIDHGREYSYDRKSAVVREWEARFRKLYPDKSDGSVKRFVCTAIQKVRPIVNPAISDAISLSMGTKARQLGDPSSASVTEMAERNAKLLKLMQPYRDMTPED